MLDAVVTREDELAAGASPGLERLPRERVAPGCRIVGEPGVARCLRRDRQRPRGDELGPRGLRAKRVAIDLTGVRGVAGQDVEAAVASGIELHLHGLAAVDRVERRRVGHPEEALTAVGVGVERLAVVVAARRALHGAEAEAAAGERRPHRAGVLAAEDLRRGDDRAAGDDETGAAALHLQAVDHVLEGPVVAARVPRLVDVRVEPVLVDQVPVEIPEHGCPAVAEAVRQGQRRAVEPAARLEAVVRERLDRHVARVWPRTNAGAVAVVLEERVRAHPARLVRIVQRRIEQERDGEVVAPALARLLVPAQAVDTRAAGEPVRDAVGVLVDDDAVLEVAVADPRVIRVLADGSGRRTGGDGGLERVPVGLRDRDGGNGHRRGRHRGRQDGRAGARVVGDDDAARAQRLGGLHAQQERAGGGAAVHDRDPGSRGRARGVLGGAAARAGVDERPRHPRRGRRGPEPGPARVEGAHSVRHHLVLRPELIAGPQEHLHPRRAAGRGRLDRRREVGVVRPAPVGCLGAHVVARGAAAAVVVRLEVARRLVEPVPPHDVVEDVVRVEEVRDDGIAVVLRVLVQIGREVERQARAAVCVAEVRRVVVVLVEVGVDVGAAGDGELGAWRPIGVVPPEGRRRRVGRIRHEPARRVVGALLRDVEDAVARAVQDRIRRGGPRGDRGRRVARARQRTEIAEAVLARPVVDCEQLAARGVDRRVPEMLGRRVVDRELPGEAQAALGRLPAEASRDRLVRDAPAREDGLLRGTTGLAQDAQADRLLELEPVGGRLDRPDRIDLRIGGSPGLQSSLEGPPAKTTRPSAATLPVAWAPKTSRSRKRWLRLTCVTPL